MAPNPTPTYGWCCFACGSSNAPATAICTVCQCPAKVTVGQLEEFRSALLSHGTPLTPRATHLHEPPEIGALAVLSPVLCVLTFGLCLGSCPGNNPIERQRLVGCSMRSNPSIERTSSGRLSLPEAAAHVER